MIVLFVVVFAVFFLFLFLRHGLICSPGWSELSVVAEDYLELLDPWPPCLYLPSRFLRLWACTTMPSCYCRFLTPCHIGIYIMVDLALCFQLALLSWGKPMFGDLCFLI